MKNYENNTERVNVNYDTFQSGDFIKSFLPNPAISAFQFYSLKPSESSGSELQVAFESAKKYSNNSIVEEILENVFSPLIESIRVLFGLKKFSKKNCNSNEKIANGIVDFTNGHKSWSLLELFSFANKKNRSNNSDSDDLIDLNALHTLHLFDHKLIANDNIPNDEIPSLSHQKRRQGVAAKIEQWKKEKLADLENGLLVPENSTEEQLIGKESESDLNKLPSSKYLLVKESANFLTNNQVHEDISR